MSDEMQIPESYQDHPLVVGGGARSEWFQRLRREAWEDFRGCPPSDIKATVEWMSKQWQKWEEAADNLAEQNPELALHRYVQAWTVRYRLGALIDMLDYIAVHGPHNIPRWGKRPEEARNEDLEGLTPFLPDGKIKAAKRRREMHEEFWSRRGDGDPAEEVKEELAEDYDCSEATIENTIYPKKT